MYLGVAAAILAAGCEQIIGIEDLANRAGRVRVLDVDVITPGTEALGGLRGAALDIGYRDLTREDDRPIFGTSPIDGCYLVQRHQEPGVSPEVNAGPIALAGDGLRMTVGPCGYFGGYFCTSYSTPFGSTSTITARSNAPKPTITYSFEAGTTFAGADLVGSYLQIQGFTKPAFNRNAAIVAHDASSLTVLATAPMGDTEVSTGAGFAVNLGFFGPIPAAGVDADFLGDGAVTIDKDADPDGADGPAMHLSVPVGGTGFALDDASKARLVFPSAAEDVELSCAGAGGNCGPEVAADIIATAVSARAVRSKIDGLDAWSMPLDSDFLQLECIYPDSSTARIPAAAVQTILDFAPTRIELRVERVAGAIVEDPAHPSNQTVVLVGHALTRHSDPKR